MVSHPDLNTARSIAKAWRAGTYADRRWIEDRITREDRWNEFRYSRDGDLICKLGKDYFQSIACASSHSRLEPIENWMGDDLRNLISFGLPTSFTESGL